MSAFPKFTETQWKVSLEYTINCPAFDEMQEGQYTRVVFYPENQEQQLPLASETPRNDFATKCLLHRLYNTYEGDGLKEKWYSALREWWRHENIHTDDGNSDVNKSAKEDAERFFLHFTDGNTFDENAFCGNQLTSVTIPNSAYEDWRKCVSWQPIDIGGDPGQCDDDWQACVSRQFFDIGDDP